MLHQFVAAIIIFGSRTQTSLDLIANWNWNLMMSRKWKWNDGGKTYFETRSTWNNWNMNVFVSTEVIGFTHSFVVSNIDLCWHVKREKLLLQTMMCQIFDKYFFKKMKMRYWWRFIKKNSTSYSNDKFLGANFKFNYQIAYFDLRYLYKKKELNFLRNLKRNLPK